MCAQGVRCLCGEHRVGVGFQEDAKLLRLYTEFLTSPNFYTFAMLAHFFISALRPVRACLYFLVHICHSIPYSGQRPSNDLLAKVWPKVLELKEELEEQ